MLARIDVQLRQSRFNPEAGKEKILTYKDLVLDLERYDAMIHNQSLQLSKREYEILKLLMENPRKVFTKNNLYESIWNSEFLEMTIQSMFISVIFVQKSANCSRQNST